MNPVEIYFNNQMMRKAMPPSCTVCDAEFDTTSQMWQHMEDSGHCKCPRCGDLFNSFNSRNQHFEHCKNN